MIASGTSPLEYIIIREAAGSFISVKIKDKLILTHIVLSKLRRLSLFENRLTM